MAGAITLSSSQGDNDRQWLPTRHKTIPSYRRIRPIHRRMSSLRANLRRKPLSTINEDRVPSLNSNSTGSLLPSTALPCRLPVGSHSSEHLIHIRPSEELQALQSVSSHSTSRGYGSTPTLFRTQSQWMAPSPEFYMPSGIPEWQEATVTGIDSDDYPESGVRVVAVEEDLAREEVASLLSKSEDRAQNHPEEIRDSGKVWVRVDRTGHSLTKPFKTMGLLHKKRTFEARLGHNVPVQSQLEIYEKPNATRRIGIVARHCWRRLRNWSTGRDTALQGESSAADYPHPFTDISIMSLALFDPDAMASCSRSRDLERPGRLQKTRQVQPARKDSKVSIGEQPLRRNPKLFLDVYPSDRSCNGSVCG